MTYEELHNTYGNLFIKEMNLKEVSNLKGLYYDSCIAIEKSLSSVEKACVLAEEIGHHYTTEGNILDLSKSENRKQERKARAWAYNEQIGLMGIINAYKERCNSIFDIADFLGVSEGFLREAICYYTEKYGRCTTIDNYIIFFIPGLAVIENISCNNFINNML